MASVDQPFQTQDQENQNQQNTGGGNQPPQIASGTGNIGGGGGSTQSGNNSNGSAPTPTTSASANQNTSSGTYPNLQKYMNANANWNQSSGGLGGEIASNLNQQGSQVENSINQANTGFQNQGNAWETNTNAANNAFQQGLTGGAANYLQNNQNAQQQANTALNAQYTGPANLNAVNPNLQQQTNSYANTAQQGTTEAGRFNLLQQMFGGNNYTQGQQNLDQALLQGNKGQMQQLQSAAQQGTQAQQNLTNAAATDQNLGNQWAAFANQTQQGARGALNSTIGSQNQTIQNEFQNAQTAQTAQIAQIANELNSGQISQQDLNMLQGLNVGQNLYNVQGGQYVQGQQLNAQNTGTAQDYANMQALAKLGGTNGAVTTPNSQILGQFANTPGTLYNSTNDINFNNTGFQSAINNAAQAYQSSVAPDVQNINSALPFINLNNPQATGGGVLTDPTTLAAKTYAQLGMAPGQTFTDSDFRNSPLLQQTMNYYQGQGETQAGGPTADQQAQLNTLNSILGANPNNTAIQQQLTILNQQIAQNPQQLTAAAMQTATPLDYLKSLYNQGGNALQNYENQWSWAPGAVTGISSFQNLEDLNKQYDPTKTLQLTPAATPQLAAMMPNAGAS